MCIRGHTDMAYTLDLSYIHVIGAELQSTMRRHPTIMLTKINIILRHKNIYLISLNIRRTLFKNDKLY